MSDPKQPQRKTEELDLDAEIVRDLELDGVDVDAVRGGPGNSGHSSCVPGRAG